jgi:hypothetical protein
MPTSFTANKVANPIAKSLGRKLPEIHLIWRACKGDRGALTDGSRGGGGDAPISRVSCGDTSDYWASAGNLFIRKKLIAS